MKKAIGGRQPTLPAERLELRPFVLEDAQRVRSLAGEFEVADTTLTIPHPYPDGAAEEWIGTHRPAWQAGRRAIFAITEGDVVIGAIELHGIDGGQGRAELGFWVGLPFWNKGYCSEAARTIVGFAFRDLGLHRVQARHFVRNPASGRVLQKIGMREEGLFRGAEKRWGKYEDIVVYGVGAEELPGLS